MSTTTRPRVPGGIAAPVLPLLSSRLIVLGNLLRWGARVRYGRLLGLTNVEFGIVAALGDRTDVPSRDLVAILGVDKGLVSRSISVLVSRNLIKKTTSPSDKRDALVSLTKEGKRAHDTIIRKAREINERLVANLAGVDLGELNRSIELLSQEAQSILDEEMSD